MASKRSNSPSRSYQIFTCLIISALLLAGCAKKGATTPTPIPPSPTVQAQLATPAATIQSGPAATQAPLDTPTSMPASPTPQPPMATETPVLLNSQSLTAIPAQTTGSIIFASGTTATVVQGTLQPAQIATYTIQAGQSQPMILIMDSPHNDVTLGVFEPNGSVLLDPVNKWRSWQAVLPRTELYRIQVTGGATAENFTMTVKVAQIVNFASGSSSITLNGTTAYGYPFDYSLNCGAGQTMTANLNVPSSTAYLDIFGGATSEMLLNDSARASTWTGVLPQTQPYVVEVVPNNYHVINFGLTVSCTGAVQNTSNASGNLVIKPGSTAVVVQGTISHGQVVTYTIQGYQYQPLIVNVDSPKFDVTLSVRAPDGSLMFDPAKKWINWQVPLHETGLYTIQLFGGATTENYILTVKLPKHVYLDPDTNTATIKSATEQGFIVSYAVNGNAGETLTASLNISSNIAFLDIFGVGTGSLLSYGDHSNSWTGKLKQTQLYVIEVIPAGGKIVGYSLTISLH